MVVTKKNQGFTLTEVLIVLMIMGMVMLVAVQVYWDGMISSGKQSSYSVLQTGAKNSLDGILSNVKASGKVAKTYEGYTTNGTNVVLAIPAVDSSSNFIYSSGTKIYDYYIYYLSGTDLHKKTRSDNPSSVRYSQNNVDTVVLSDVTSLAFAYDDATINNVRVVTVSMSVVNTKHSLTVNVTGKGRLRNV